MKGLDKKKLLLYAVTDRRWLGEDTLCRQVEEAVKGGVTFIQLREKEMEHGEFLKEALEIKTLCGRYEVPLVINDDVRIAAVSGADGVHLGQGDMALEEARKILGEDRIIGVSARTVEQALEAEKNGADYIGAGSVFSTGSKADAVKISYDTLKAICSSVSIPVIAIGGVNAENVRELSGSGICGIAAISAVFGKGDTRKAASNLRQIVEETVYGRKR